ncbi:alpha/beta hydrolase [Antrihabitans sp. YC2-6]|uniref:alpha/beta hydrolase n=1 Tax=Antrihabitans sp. YC2-6 TaxID=2799498 RepID=UPI0018F2B6CE|nr:alpha/beta hydrolase [Antrihabitans sp. YC2-6]MBJ8345798.1 alpha/beta hydrolase [Antrihabitans sp. YC2-6]
MSLDTDVQSLLAGLGAQGMQSFELVGVDATRAIVETFTGLQMPPREVAKVIESAYPGPAGPQQLRIYVPDADAPLPVVVYFHGGGFVGGGLAVADEPVRALANDVGAIVVAVSYRLAPEHKFPAATDDTFAALKWVAAHAADFGGDPARIAVMGDSAGGGLAAVTAQRARDEGGPDLVAQVLVYPVVDPTAKLPSRIECGSGYIITAAALDWFWDQYLTGPADLDNSLAVPARAKTLSGLPPALVLSTQYEVSRDEAEAYATKLAAGGVETEAIRFDGLVHGVYWMSGAVPRSVELRDAITRFLTKQFAR